MKLKTIGIGVGVLVAVIGLWIGLDALFVSDEERIEELVDLLQSELNGQVVDDILGWMDPDRQPIEIVALGQTLTYDSTNAADLRERATDGLRPYHGEQFSAWQSGVTVEEDDATVTMRLRSENRGFVNVEMHLRRDPDDEDRWLVSYVRVGG